MYIESGKKRRVVTARIGVRVLETSVRVRANDAALLPRFPLRIEVPSLLTDFHDPRAADAPAAADGEIILEDRPKGPLTFVLRGTTARFSGPLVRAESEASDPRYTLWGNQGFLFRFILRLLEEKHAIYSFHAAGLYDEAADTLYVIAGGAGRGKTVYLLSGLDRGLKLFSTETVHVRLGRRGAVWFKGSLVDNVRLGTLAVDFPSFAPAGIAAVREDDLWRQKTALDLSARQTARDRLTAPRVVLIFPHIEEGRPGHVLAPVVRRESAAKAVFDNIAQKIGETVVLDDALAIPGLDSAALAAARWALALRLVRSASVIRIASVLSNPRECWGGLLDVRRNERRRLS
jgi:hypothetical protein